VTTFRVWAPLPRRVELLLRGERREMQPARGGWWRADVPDAGPGTDYAFILDDAGPFPDPRSPWQPAGVDGPSRTVDHSSFSWTDRGWRAAPLASAVLYELHVGTFTLDGTFESAIEHLDQLVDLGVTHVELMPVNEFAGRRGWGYDGVLLYAPYHAYGGPEGLKRLVDACHARGLAIVLDVVYNHLGPTGNHLPRFGPYVTEHHRTPWGGAINLDGPGSDEVRRFVVDSALGWLRDYHVDALRIDAVHAIVDTSAVHLLEQLSGEVEALASHLGRPLALIAESDLNDPRLVRSREAGGYGLDAQWNDDAHHALHVALTAERDRYYADFRGLADFSRALAGNYAYDGRFSAFRGRRHGRPAADLPASRFVAFLQNHDQVGNRVSGERLSMLVDDDLLAAGAALLLLSPFVPLLFMGEEWAAGTPFLYFTDHPPELGEAIRAGRQAEFTAAAESGGLEARLPRVPDPQDPATFEVSKLDWSEPAGPRGSRMLAWYRALLALRRARPELAAGRHAGLAVDADVSGTWMAVRRGDVVLACNLGHEACRVTVDGVAKGGVLLNWGARPRVAGDGATVELEPRSTAVLEARIGQAG
jgi:maltooligosyltrehalose trehalohydrolase